MYCDNYVQKKTKLLHENCIQIFLFLHRYICNIFIFQINSITYISIVIITIEFIREAHIRNYKKFPYIKL